MAPAVQSSQIVECDCVCRLGFPRVSRKSTCPRSTRWQLRLRPTEDFQTRVDLGATKVTREARARGDRSDINLTAAFSHRYVKLHQKIERSSYLLLVVILEIHFDITALISSMFNVLFQGASQYGTQKDDFLSQF